MRSLLDRRSWSRDARCARSSTAGPGLAPPAPPESDEDGGVARITLRLPEHLKNKAEEAAAGAGQSLNTWLVTVVRDATRDGAARVDVDLSSRPLAGGFDPFGRRAGRRTTGWL
ncbi:toxin-antitoxin system HicB family antitoxin [Nocardioides sp. AX2bis]|uniref:toxin-antitoxin system HicB family antitoxin n=1 Tax=Nocardioides sp. AX2bis TaxID=2653157 RepID=UPI00135CE3C3|nr:toxin-antitoxin system HicB family antitoxin [Nocardioides sp. AX2bis]